MAETDTDIVANWHDRVSTLRKRGRISDAALAVVPADEIDVRRGRPPAPERLSEAERALWDHLVRSGVVVRAKAQRAPLPRIGVLLVGLSPESKAAQYFR